MSRSISPITFTLALILVACGAEGEFPTEAGLAPVDEVVSVEEQSSALRAPAAALCSGDDCTTHQGCFYVNRYANWPSRDPNDWEYHTKNCVVYDGKCNCPGITPWSLLINTCKNRCVGDDDDRPRRRRGERNFSSDDEG
jgi:hypothetical protein